MNSEVHAFESIWITYERWLVEKSTTLFHRAYVFRFFFSRASVTSINKATHVFTHIRAEDRINLIYIKDQRAMVVNITADQ